MTTTTVPVPVRGAWRDSAASASDRALVRSLSREYAECVDGIGLPVCATGRSAGSRGVAPVVTAGAPSRRGVKIHNGRTVWPVRATAQCGVMVEGTSADAVALAVLAVDECTRLRRASRRASRTADRCERDHAAQRAAVTGLITAEPSAVLADTDEPGRYLAWQTAASAAIRALDTATANRAEARRCASILSDAYAVWRRWVILAHDGLPATPSADAYAVADAVISGGQSFSAHLRSTRASVNAASDSILQEITKGSS
jgi:hypothetical protein